MIDIKNLICHYCDRSFSVLSALKLHCTTTKIHQENVIKSGIQHDIKDIKKIRDHKIAENNRMKRNSQVIFIDNLCKVPLNDGSYILINNFVWDIISQYTITHNTLYEYPHINIDNNAYRLHCYIYYKIFKNVKRLGYYIDHRNNDRLDITIENLRQISPGSNNRNKTKMKNTSSKYNGVSYDKKVMDGYVN